MRLEIEYCPKMRLDRKNTGQIFEENELRFFISKLVSSILLKMDFCKDAARTHMDYLFSIEKEKNFSHHSIASTLPIFLRVFPNFLIPL